MSIIVRQNYLDKIVDRLDRGVMIFLVGQRRVGKSSMLLQLKDYLTANKRESNIVYINKELYEFGNIASADDLYHYAIEHLPEGGSNYLLIDEVQDIQNYENALRSLQAENRCQIVATGSNAYIFSSELGTKLSGRYIEIPIYSLTYDEFLLFHKLSPSQESLLSFLRVGGLPGLNRYDINDESQVRDYLQGVYNTVIMRDVIAREQIRNVTFLENLTAFVADNVGKLFSVRNISRLLKAQGEGNSELLTTNYLKFLCKALIISPVARYDIHGKTIFEQNYKYYFADHGLRNLLCGFNLRSGIEKVIENVIWNSLLSRGFKVSVGTMRNGEIDFVASKDSEINYIQATYLLSSEETIAREFGNLKRINDNFPKYVVSMEPISGYLPQYPGIHSVTLGDFLLMK